ncbi:hypothetical protein D3C72_2272660 [compost metagenome]
MYSRMPCCTSSASVSAGLPSWRRQALTVATATSLNGCARPEPRLKMPDLSGLSRKNRLTLTTSSTDTKSRLWLPLPQPS